MFIESGKFISFILYLFKIDTNNAKHFFTVK